VSPALALAFAAAAACGALARYVLGGAVRAGFGDRPWPTLVVNLLGCVLAGAVAGLALEHDLGGSVARVLSTGFLGSFTTFSTFVDDVVRLREGNRGDLAAATAAGTLLAGIAAATTAMAIVVAAA
jgi:CrcB protein